MSARAASCQVMRDGDSNGIIAQSIAVSGGWLKDERHSEQDQDDNVIIIIIVGVVAPIV